MTKSLILFLSLFLSFASFTQTPQYNITKYISPIQKYHSLNTQFHLNAHKLDHPTQTSNAKLFSDLNAEYYQYKRTPKYQGSTNYRINLRYDIQKTEASQLQPLGEHTNTNQAKRAALTTLNQFFIHPKRFIEIDASTDIQHIKYKDVRPKQTTTLLSYNDVIFSFNLPILFGFGRINNVTENWRAARMIAEFQKHQILDHEPNKQEINELSETFTQRRYTRLFDFREKDKADLKEIHQNLVKNNLISETSIDYFTTLADMWNFGANTRRLSGFSIAFGIEPQFETRQRLYSAPTKSSNETNYLSGYLTLKTIYEKPINYKLQFSLNANIKFGQIYYREPNQSLYQKLGNHINPYLNLKLGYYPTTRTYLSTSIISYASQNRQAVYAKWQGRLYYYISPQTRLAATAYFRISGEAPLHAISRHFNNYPDLENSRTTLSFNLIHNFL